MKEDHKKALQKNGRNHTIGLLELWTSQEAQFDYKKAVPFVNIPNEMFAQWDDFFKPDQQWYREAFSDNEWKALTRFNAAFEAVCKRTPPYLPDIDEFVHTQAWQDLHETAKEVLKEFKEK